MVRFYCQACGQPQPVKIDRLEDNGLNGLSWGEITCTECDYLIAVINADEPGAYRFVKEESEGDAKT